MLAAAAGIACMTNDHLVDIFVCVYYLTRLEYTFITDLKRLMLTPPK